MELIHNYDSGAKTYIWLSYQDRSYNFPNPKNYPHYSKYQLSYYESCKVTWNNWVNTGILTVKQREPNDIT
ncbi:hypothetical protein pVco7_gp030 [Vibrio phage pVco-7]|uniref:Uncharacterized protein n=1 Tax=Vibrio phage pVco-5 TaxID=1965485 RepID=A0A1W6JUR6_9CAUD|nr:hypothetical protein KNT61_gp031 [Vibrio phage pVco-5]ARM71019.1 hypothetical protein pVco5_031 [Vibrio phage pVco-5]